jgi:predicted dehydrogenase
MADKIRVGIVGATVTQGGSGWGANAHVPALHALPDYELKAVCTAHEETARASKEAFGAEMAFHDINEMVNRPDIDMVVVSVRVPGHYDLVAAAERAGKAVFCEWPLGANLAEAEEMARLARERSLRTVVGLQGRSDPTLLYARELIKQGYIGEVLTANLSMVSGAQLERGPGRIWQSQRTNGANTLTISGGHNIDAMCMVLGEFVEVSARVSTRIKAWKLEGTGESVPVDSPDNIIVAGRLVSGAEVAVHVTAVPSNPSGCRLEIYGRDGALAITSRASLSVGPNQLYGARGREAMADMVAPDRFNLVPEGTPSGSPRNVAQAYARLADSFKTGEGFEPDFDLAVRRHRLIEAMEKASDTGTAVAVS